MTNIRHLTLLKHDVKAWNCWRQENREIELDFSGTNLSNLNLSGVNLSRVNLSRVNFRVTNLKCAYLKGANLYQACLISADLSGSDLSEVELTEANLTKADVSSANLHNANLTNVKAILTNFKKSILTGACIENWQIDSSTNLEELVCDYFYVKRQNQQRYPQDVQQNFAPGEYYQFIRNDLKNFNHIDAIVLANSNSKEKNQHIAEQNNDVIDPLDNSWEEESKKSLFKVISSGVSSFERIKQNHRLIYLSLAFLLGIIVIAIGFGRVFKKAPTSSENFITCDNSLLKQAEDAIFIRDENSLKQVMEKLEEFDSPLGGFADEQCRQTLYDVKYIYAIHVKANKEHNLLEAVKILCELPEQHYQKRKHKPWFLRWVNSFANTNFPQQLAEYIENNSCPAVNYLNQNRQ